MFDEAALSENNPGEKKGHAAYAYIEALREFVLHPFISKQAAVTHRFILLLIIAEEIYHLPNLRIYFSPVWGFIEGPVEFNYDFIYSLSLVLLFLGFEALYMAQIFRFTKQKRFAWIMLTGVNYFGLTYKLIVVGRGLILAFSPSQHSYFRTGIFISALWLAFYFLKMHLLGKKEILEMHRVSRKLHAGTFVVAAVIAIVFAYTYFWMLSIPPPPHIDIPADSIPPTAEPAH
ncbi:MAG: hypothetical protein M3R17_14560 [Bacteroidota bacterium]|nr:hypothetical protein [Bacteroidota bacterium]